MEQNELGIAIYVPKEEKYIILPFLMLVLGTVAFVYGKRQESEKHYFNSEGSHIKTRFPLKKKHLFLPCRFIAINIAINLA